MLNNDRIRFFKACQRSENLRDHYLSYNDTIESMHDYHYDFYFDVDKAIDIYKILIKQSRFFLKERDILSNTIFK